MGNNLRDASGGITRRFDDKRQLAYLLLHCGGQRIVLVFLDAQLFRIGEEPSRSIVHKGIRACPVSRGCGNGGGGAAYRDSFSRVPHRKGVAARSKQMVGGMGGGSLRKSVSFTQEESSTAAAIPIIFIYCLAFILFCFLDIRTKEQILLG